MLVGRRLFDYLGAMAILVLPLLMLVTSLKNPEKITPVDRAILRVAAPLQAGADWVVSGLGGIVGRYMWLVDVEKENDSLREELIRTRTHAHRLASKVEYVGDLEKLLGIRSDSPSEFIGGTVVASSMNSLFRVVRIRISTTEGFIETGMPVVSTVVTPSGELKTGFVGRVQNVYGQYSDVQLVSHPDSAIDIVVRRTKSRGVLRGLGREATYMASLDWLEKKEPLVVGDIVETSGLGGALPGGILVGYVGAVATKKYGIYQHVEVVPAVSIAQVRYVNIIVAGAGKPVQPTQPNALPSSRGIGVSPGVTFH